MNADQKLAKIRDICRHPGAFHWTGQQMAKTILNVMDSDEPIPYSLSDLDHPIPYELSHDAVYEEVQE